MLAIAGGTPVRQKGFPKWPIHDESDAQAVADVIRSGFWGLGGQNVAEIEKRFAAFQDASYGVATSNGTVSLWLALTALGAGPGDGDHPPTPSSPLPRRSCRPVRCP